MVRGGQSIYDDSVYCAECGTVSLEESCPHHKKAGYLICPDCSSRVRTRARNKCKKELYRYG
jgi:hypothetical protein